MFTFFTLGTILSIIAGILFIALIPIKLLLSTAIMFLNKINKRLDSSLRSRIEKHKGGGPGVIGTTEQVAGAGVQAVGKTVATSGKAVSVAGKGVKATGTTMKVAGTTTKVGGKVTSGVGKGTKTAGKGVSAVGQAISAIPVVGTIVGAGLQVAGTGIQGAGTGVDVVGKGTTRVGSATKKVGKGVHKVGEVTDNVGDKINSAGRAVDRVGYNIRQHGKQHSGMDGEGRSIAISGLAVKLAIKALKLVIKALRFLISLVEMIIPIIIALITFIGVIGVLVATAVIAAAAACIMLVMGGGGTFANRGSIGTGSEQASISEMNDDPTGSANHTTWLKSCQTVWDDYRKEIGTYDCTEGRGYKITSIPNKEVGAYCSGYVIAALDHAGYDMLDWWGWNMCPDKADLEELMQNGSDKDCMKKFLEDFQFVEMNTSDFGSNKLVAGDIIFYVGKGDRQDVGEHMEIFAGLTEDGYVKHWNWGMVYSTDDAPLGEPHTSGMTVESYLNMSDRYVPYVARLKK